MKRKVIAVEEYKPIKIAGSDLPTELAQELLARYSTQIGLSYSPFDKQWTLTPQGYVGFIPISQDTGLQLQPKVGLSNLFRMLEVAYRIPIQIEPGVFQITNLAEFYERIANILARRILDRGRKGYYRTYEPFSDTLPYLRELEHTGPGYKIGDQLMVPFLIDMDRLFETFIATWIAEHLPSGWILKPQESVTISPDHNLRYKIDLVLVDAATGKVRCVLDTKYKKSDMPVETDINQVVAYAESTGCSEAVLIYPSKLTKPVDLFVGTKHVRGLVFDLSTDLLKAGSDFLDKMLKGLSQPAPQQTLNNFP